ncbi:MAG: hypothetical protein OSJ59_12625 [Lachnospiraceae bacterium]|nr:hypothetical protein [Lachnospiraceae bacterium]
MKTASLLTKDSELDVVFGDFSFGDAPRDEAYGSLKYLYTDLTDIRKYYIRLGFHLQEFKMHEYYKDFGYLTLEEFCDVNLGLDKGAVSRCINVYLQFNASHDVTCGAGVKTVGCAMDLSERWKDYSYTQLCEMLPLSDEDRKKVTSDMTVKQIRKFKRKLKSGDVPVASTQPEETMYLNMERYNYTRGIVRQNYIRDCDALNDNVVFHVFDKNGKFLGGNVWCDLIYKDKNRYFFRLLQDRDESLPD